MSSLIEKFQNEISKVLEANSGPLLVVIAGHNGAGKTTCYEQVLKPFLDDVGLEYINADNIEREIKREYSDEGLVRSPQEFSELARLEADQQREVAIKSRRDFCFETVASHISKVSLMEQAISLGYTVILFFIGLDSPDKSYERVQLRFANGGHDVPYEKIIERYPRVIENMKLAMKVATVAIAIDNSQEGSVGSPEYIPSAIFKGGILIERINDYPKWMDPILI
ncbi:zeta toxin family protein [Polynucleobacter victoriensis]|uniref:Predicted ABC-type ATPase n=1 Tax=Polynucleobacter victoriensis TaxID=2049319 RepID=A0A212SZJ9_9BURK|nr:zeta toxin family protein [Polynucleobacter victoriensis]SNC59179.1 Predicted ABC-type ATPase [Polynucleobacter victoriensis]